MTDFYAWTGWTVWSGLYLSGLFLAVMVIRGAFNDWRTRCQRAAAEKFYRHHFGKEAKPRELLLIDAVYAASKAVTKFRQDKPDDNYDIASTAIIAYLENLDAERKP